ncbi:four-carbon acid sugar kinase family protein [Halobacteria archaeon AArc-m2/3/4]|uniref:Four-carbon acid sugar kinase family protein n=1 Tax=Natronoglomus mannanivorans TaxID=2979990 RepID=A0ABT2QKL7_9EURY|nr:four-carbon acid sugar kinase family protein [Halobacteria archaeon AArc-m2/3/4]
MSDELLLSYYGDDLTGSTDVLEGLARNGVRTVLFLDPPTKSDLAQFDDLDAVGIAGQSRSMTPEEMTEELPPVFEALERLGTTLIHYKVCSTFDSSPEVGSIGRAIELGQKVFDSPFVPVSQGSRVPSGRYVVFGNLFAEQDGDVYRIDRHPTMSQHPVTPMTEADLRRHLEAQTDLPIGSVELPDLERDDDAEAALEDVVRDAEVVVFDGYDVDHVERIGRLVWERAEAETGPLFVVGSSGIEHHALPQHWNSIGLLENTGSMLTPQPPAEQIAVVSGSASPVTAAQISWATENGFEAIRVDTERLIDPATAADERARVVEAGIEAIDAGRSVVFYSADGPDDPAIERTNQRFESLDVDDGLAARLGCGLGSILRRVLSETGLKRACIAGGDTSGFVARELDFYALEPIAATDPGAPLCRAFSLDPAFDGLQITLKGGQTGDVKYFGLVREGGVDAE